MATIITTAGKTIALDDLSLAALQKAVGGYIEAVRTHNDCLMYINENGKVEDLPLNLKASTLYRYGRRDPIAGDVVVLTMEETAQMMEDSCDEDLD